MNKGILIYIFAVIMISLTASITELFEQSDKSSLIIVVNFFIFGFFYFFYSHLYPILAGLRRFSKGQSTSLVVGGSLMLLLSVGSYIYISNLFNFFTLPVCI